MKCPFLLAISSSVRFWFHVLESGCDCCTTIWKKLKVELIPIANNPTDPTLILCSAKLDLVSPVTLKLWVCSWFLGFWSLLPTKRLVWSSPVLYYLVLCESLTCWMVLNLNEKELSKIQWNFCIQRPAVPIKTDIVSIIGRQWRWREKLLIRVTSVGGGLCGEVSLCQCSWLNPTVYPHKGPI